MDRLQLLEVFLSLSETRSVTGTALQFGLSQSTISRMLQRLESLTRLPLVRRGSRGVALTREGEELALAAPGILESWSAAMARGRQDRAQLSGRLRVVAPVAMGQGMLAVVLSRFLLLHPALSIELELRDDPIDLASTRYDLWVRAGTAPDNLVVQHVLHIRRLLVAAPGVAKGRHPRSLANVRAVRLRPFIPRAVTLTHSSGETFRLVQKEALTCEHLQTIRVAALEAVGYAVLPLWAVKLDLEDHKLVRLCPAWEPPSLKISLAFLPNASRPARLNALIRFLRDELTTPGGVGMSYLRQNDIAETIQTL